MSSASWSSADGVRQRDGARFEAVDGPLGGDEQRVSVRTAEGAVGRTHRLVCLGVLDGQGGDPASGRGEYDDAPLRGDVEIVLRVDGHPVRPGQAAGEFSVIPGLPVGVQMERHDVSFHLVGHVQNGLIPGEGDPVGLA